MNALLSSCAAAPAPGPEDAPAEASDPPLQPSEADSTSSALMLRLVEAGAVKRLDALLAELLPAAFHRCDHAVPKRPSTEVTAVFAVVAKLVQGSPEARQSLLQHQQQLPGPEHCGVLKACAFLLQAHQSGIQAASQLLLCLLQHCHSHQHATIGGEQHQQHQQQQQHAGSGRGDLWVGWVAGYLVDALPPLKCSSSPEELLRHDGFDALQAAALAPELMAPEAMGRVFIDCPDFHRFDAAGGGMWRVLYSLCGKGRI